AEEANDLSFKRAVLVDLGNVYEMDYQISQAIGCFESALDLLEDAEQTHNLSRGYTLENLGYCKLLSGETANGIALIHKSIEYLDDAFGLAEAYIDLCYGYLEIDDLDQARQCGQTGLDRAQDARHVRNAHYLLGEVAYKSGDSEAAEFHFEQLARFYPEFRNLKSLLFGIDLRGLVNLKL
ncbi:MAG TPA: hypothetical protein VEZ11_05695, partial [Thermoanaerobaculia bacterium]|nr:hypothetical protein [Thermoanaerobaculia bacterium]